MKIKPPSKEINIYSDGFEAHDLLARKPLGDKVSELIERISDPLVLALNGGWGTGKTHFLKCWVGEHSKSEDHNAMVFYFDAFAHDYLDDPLYSLTSTICNDKPNLPEGWGSKIKTITTRLLKPATKIALAFGTAGVSEIVNPLGAAALQQANSEANDVIDDIWAKENSLEARMSEFREGLKDLTADADGEATQRVVVVVDELDRCRPDYALSVLETIKHFFNVENVHFILGTNLTELQNSVKKRFGADVNAELYLQKFITATISLPKTDSQRSNTYATQAYFSVKARDMKIPTQIVEDLEYILKLPGLESRLSLRDVEHLLSQIALMSDLSDLSNKYEEFRYAALGLALLKVIEPNLYGDFLTGRANAAKLIDCFGIETKHLKHSDDAIANLSLFYYFTWHKIVGENVPDLVDENVGSEETLLERFNSQWRLPTYDFCREDKWRVRATKWLETFHINIG